MSTRPALSSRIRTLNDGGSDGWGLYRKAQAARAAGQAIIDLTIGEPDLPVDPRILDALHGAAQAGGSGYTPPGGLPKLRAAIAARVEARTGVPTAPENIAVTAGGQAALFAAHLLTCGDGGTGLVLDPYYATYPSTIRAAGGEPRVVPCPPETGFLPEPAALAKALPTARSLLITTPGNPTGRVFDRATLGSVAEATARAGAWLVADEVYETLCWTGPHLSARAIPGAVAHTLVIGSMSKAFAMTGARLGWVVGPPEAVAAIEDLSTNTNYGFAPFVQQAALYALTEREDVEILVAQTFRARRDLAVAALQGHPRLGLVAPEGGMFVLLDVRATGLSGQAFAERLFETARIAVMPGGSFGQSAAGFVRVALTAPASTLSTAIGQLTAFADTL